MVCFASRRGAWSPVAPAPAPQGGQGAWSLQRTVGAKEGGLPRKIVFPAPVGHRAALKHAQDIAWAHVVLNSELVFERIPKGRAVNLLKAALPVVYVDQFAYYAVRLI